MTLETEAAIRNDYRVQRAEQEIRDAAGADGLEFLFTEKGRHMYARLAGLRVRVAIELKKSRK